MSLLYLKAMQSKQSHTLNWAVKPLGLCMPVNVIFWGAPLEQLQTFLLQAQGMVARRNEVPEIVQLGAATCKEDTLEYADRLRSLIDEHSSLQALMLWSNWRLAGRRTASTSLEIATPGTWQTVMVRLEGASP